MEIRPTEASEQKAFVNWLELQKYKFTAIPNSTYTTSNKQKRENYEMGLRAGLPDMLVLVNKKIVWIEMKRSGEKMDGTPKNNPTPRQQDWIDKLNECQGVKAFVCRSYEEAVEAIKNEEKTGF